MCRTILKPISRPEGKEGEIAANKYDFRNSFTHHEETSKTSHKNYLQITFSAYSVKLKSLSYSCDVCCYQSTDSSYMDECCPGKESTSMCPRE